jgi:predicted aconitase
MALVLEDVDRAMQAGEAGPAAAFAFEILNGFAGAVGASGFLDISGAHIDGCLYHGQVSLDFVERLIELGGRVKVPTTLNVGSMDLIHPEIMRQPEAEKPPLARLMTAHEDLGCVPSFTCAPYQTLFRPRFSQQIAWGESNAIVFANSVIGARTNRYGDFIDLCAAITGRVPAWGLHLDEHRHGQLLFRLKGFSDAELERDMTFVGIGMIIGFESGEKIPVIEGLATPRDEDQLKALGAASATTGAVGLFHAVGITPEAPTLADAFGGREPERIVEITPADISGVLTHLSGVADGTPLTAVCLGTPHFSRMEWDRLLSLLGDVDDCPKVPIYVNTGRETLDGLGRDGKLAFIEDHNIRVVTDTCTYLTAILERLDGAVMTNSGKWAHYAPANIGVKVAFGSMEDCVASAIAGTVVRLGQ